MKHVLLIIMLALLPLTAHACKPAATKYIHAGSVGANAYLYWWCDATQFGWSHRIAADETTAQLEADAAYWFGLADAAPARPVDDPVVVELWAAAWAAMQADTDRPPLLTPTGWFVANSGYPDRPMYSVTNGVRATKANGERATVGDRCRCDPPYRIDEGRTTYCALDSGVPLVESFTVGAFSVSVCREVK